MGSLPSASHPDDGAHGQQTESLKKLILWAWRSITIDKAIAYQSAGFLIDKHNHRFMMKFLNTIKAWAWVARRAPSVF